MSDLKLLRALILSWWVLLPLILCLDLALEPYLPASLIDYVNSGEYFALSFAEIPVEYWGVYYSVLAVLMVALILLWVASSVGLWLAKKWARISCTVVTCLGLLLTAVSSPSVSHSIAEAFYYLQVLIEGAILLLIWRSSLFEQPSA